MGLRGWGKFFETLTFLGVLANKSLLAEIVPANKSLVAGTVPDNKRLLAETVQANNSYPLLNSGKDIMHHLYV